jgi:hypothetical protein
LTYAQKLCCGAPKPIRPAARRCKIRSARKLLILLDRVACAFSGRLRQALDFAEASGTGPAWYQQSYPQNAIGRRKALWNQALTRIFEK